ncbi:RT0821/Lpp0805 family surface protein [Photobacterium sp. 1_MG-2023]|uniref:RT0821/Lpp0805 family surface protein n=1 Tax=Photobacterium sp. 1_MG-2023 TaxID=3062646 RepID=UPI0026E14CB2|nr:RT0821/Lpp0805 family surface protein [Photobacterium sp. 1_MG-2023]MDO6705594.1 RT0821/Lpp0805 family surface protein [Photobacterium sp. 1_MG-2023]
MSSTGFFRRHHVTAQLFPLLLLTLTSITQANPLMPSAGHQLALLSTQQPIYNPQVAVEKKTGRISKEELKNGVMDSRLSFDIDQYLAIKNQKIQTVPANRYRMVQDIRVTRPYGNWYSGYGELQTDAQALPWLAFTAIHFELLNQMTERQQRQLEQAQIEATRVSVGNAIQWQVENASGSVTPTREGTTTSGRYCREFIQEVRINDTTATAMGTACQLDNGRWEIVTTG